MYGDKSVTRPTIHVSCKKFAHSRESLVDEERPGHACSQQPASFLPRALQSVVLQLHVICTSVTLVDQYHICWKSWKLIAWTISPTPSLFVAKRPSTYSQGNMDQFWGDWEKVACWSTKATISPKHVKTEEKLLWMAYRNSPMLFRTVPSRPPTASSPRLEVCNPHPKRRIAVISGTGKATDFKFGRYIHMAHPNKSPLKIFGKRESGHIQGLPKVFKYPPPIISVTDKATNFKFCTHIHRIDWNKSPLKVTGKVAMGILRDSRKFQGTDIGASCGHFCCSSAFLFHQTITSLLIVGINV